MITNGKIVAFIATRDGARAKAFYGDRLGLRLLSEDRFALVFDANGTMLRVQVVEDVSAAKYTRLGWDVADIVATRDCARGAGSQFRTVRRNEPG